VSRRLSIVVLAGLGIVLVGVLASSRGSAKVTYLTAPVERGDLRTMVTATGKLDAVVTVKVGSQLSGQIAEVLVDFNDEVKKGQPIAKLDPQTLAARVREADAGLEVAKATVAIEHASVDKTAADEANARAALTVAEALAESARVKAADAERELERRRTLLKSATIASSEVDRALAESRSAEALLRAAEGQFEVQKSAVRAAQASRAMAEADLLHANAAVKQQQAVLDEAEVELARTVIRAPIDGVVVSRDIELGQTVAATLEAPTLFTIAQDLRQMEVHAKIDEADIGRITVDQRAGFTVDAFPGREFAGTVAQIRKAPEVTQNVVTYTVSILAENPKLLLLPGMTAIVHILVEEVHDVLKVPNSALRFRPPPDVAARDATAAEAPAKGAPAVVWVQNQDGAATAVQVGLGATDASASELVAGPLNEGDKVIVGIAPAPVSGWFFGLRLGL
jgi:HlyD family secretion protein